MAEHYSKASVLTQILHLYQQAVFYNSLLFLYHNSQKYFCCRTSNNILSLAINNIWNNQERTSELDRRNSSGELDYIKVLGEDDNICLNSIFGAMVSQSLVHKIGDKSHLSQCIQSLTKDKQSVLYVLELIMHLMCHTQCSTILIVRSYNQASLCFDVQKYHNNSLTPRRAEINGLAALGQSAEDSGAAAGSESNFVKNHSY